MVELERQYEEMEYLTRDFANAIHLVIALSECDVEECECVHV